MSMESESMRLVPEASRTRDAFLRAARDWVRDPGGRVVGALAIYGIAFLAWQIFGWGGVRHRALISDLAFIPVSLAAAALAFRAGRQPDLDPKTARAWRIIAASFFLYWLGDAIWTLEQHLGSGPFPSIADIAYVAFYPLLLWGIFAFPTGPKNATERTKLWLDGGTVLVGSAMLLWYFSLGPTAQATGSNFLESAVSIAYPIGDLILLFGITRILLDRPARGSGHALGILASGLLVLVLGDVGFAHLELNGSYAGGDWPDSAFMIAQILTVVSAQYQYWYASRGHHGLAVRTPEPRTFSPYPVRRDPRELPAGGDRGLEPGRLSDRRLDGRRADRHSAGRGASDRCSARESEIAARAPAAREHRFAHGTREPPSFLRARRARVLSVAAGRPSARRDDDRHRSLQVDQRHLRPRGRGLGAAERRHASAPTASAQATSSDATAETRSSSCSPTRTWMRRCRRRTDPRTGRRRGDAERAPCAPRSAWA